jgi:hypothetical protein
MTPDQHRAAMMALSIAAITSPAENRMRTRTAKEQHAAALAELQREQQESIPDPEDDSSLSRQLMR